MFRYWLNQNNSKIQLINLASLTFLDFEVIFMRHVEFGHVGKDGIELSATRLDTRPHIDTLLNKALSLHCDYCIHLRRIACPYCVYVFLEIPLCVANSTIYLYLVIMAAPV